MRSNRRNWFKLKRAVTPPGIDSRVEALAVGNPARHDQLSESIKSAADDALGDRVAMNRLGRLVDDVVDEAAILDDVTNSKLRQERIRKRGRFLLFSMLAVGRVASGWIDSDRPANIYADEQQPYQRLGLAQPSSKEHSVVQYEKACMEQKSLPVAHGTATIYLYEQHDRLHLGAPSLISIKNPIVIYRDLSAAQKRTEGFAALTASDPDILAFAGRNSASSGKESLLKIFPLGSQYSFDPTPDTSVWHSTSQISMQRLCSPNGSDPIAFNVANGDVPTGFLSDEPVGLISNNP